MSFEKVEIGTATLYRGDCLEIMPMLADKSVDLIFTDPPYGHKNGDGDLIHHASGFIHKKWDANATEKYDAPRLIANDGAEANELYRAMLNESKRILVNGGCCCCCCCGGGGEDPQFARWAMWMDETIHFKQMVIWDKGKMGMGWHYRRSYETVLVGYRNGALCKWYDESNKIENVIRPGDYGIRKIIPQADEHPTPKPPELAAHFIRLHSRVGEIVFDPFMGHASTGIAAINERRKFIGIELDQKFFDIACKRIEAAQAQMRMELAT